MTDRFSTNGDGKRPTPKNRISSVDGQPPAHPGNPQNEREQQIIEALWTEAEDDLKRFRVPHRVEHCYYSDYDHGYPQHQSLCWTRYGKGWRIVHEVRTAYSEIDEKHDDECEWKPITECPLDLRLAMIGEFQNLRKKVVEAAEQAVSTLDEAISSFRKILKP